MKAQSVHDMHNPAEPMTANAVTPAKPKHAGGRPTKYSPETAAEICRRISNGVTLTAIDKDPDMPCRDTVHEWRHKHREFSDAYARARLAWADDKFDEIIEISDAAKPEDERVARLKIDARKWVISKVNPSKYGDRQIVENISVETQEQQDDRQLARAVLLALGANLQSLVKPELSARETANLIQGEMSKVLDVEPEDV